jgi:hypothetical protein
VFCTSTGVDVVSEPSTGTVVLRTVAAVDATATDSAVVTQAACPNMGKKKDVPTTKENAANALLFLAKE